MNKYSDEQKQEVIEQYANGESVSDIVADFQIPRSTIYSWITENQNSKSIFRLKSADWVLFFKILRCGRI